MQRPNRPSRGSQKTTRATRSRRFKLVLPEFDVQPDVDSCRGPSADQSRTPPLQTGPLTDGRSDARQFHRKSKYGRRVFVGTRTQAANATHRRRPRATRRLGSACLFHETERFGTLYSCFYILYCSLYLHDYLLCLYC